MTETQKQFHGGKTVSSTAVLEHLNILRQKANKQNTLNLLLTPSINIKSKRITDLNVKCKTMKRFEEHIGENLPDLWFGQQFLDMIQKAWYIKEKIYKLDLIKIKNLCSANHSVKGMKR